jgi:hypothetical protein
VINKKVWRKHKTEIIFVSVALIAALFSHKDIQKGMDSLASEKERVSLKTAEKRRLEESQELVKTRAAIAEQRYKDGCTIVVAVNSPRNLATLVEGETVLDRTSKKSLPAGTVVCDGNGSTGILASNAEGIPVTTDLAYTGNRQLAIEQVRKIKGAKVFYFTPEK